MKKLLVLALALGVSGQVWADKKTIQNLSSRPIMIFRNGNACDHSNWATAPGMKEVFTFRYPVQSCYFSIYSFADKDTPLGSIDVKSAKSYYQVTENNGKFYLE